MKKYYLALFLFFFFKNSYSQGEAAVPFLELQQSPLLLGAGQIGVSIPMSEPLGFYFNPAQLGYYSRENNFSFLALPQKTKWLESLFPGLLFQTLGVTAGYNFKKDNNNLPFSIGIGYIHNKLGFGEFRSYNNTFESYDAFDCFSIGASYEYYLLFNIGFSIKPFDSHLSPPPTDGTKPGEASGTAFDFGALIIAPISQLLFTDKYNLDDKSYVKPDLDFSLGYSVLNIGKKIAYVDQAPADPIPRTARFGYTFNFGLDLFTAKYKINAIDYSFTAEAEDILIKSDSLHSQYYQGIFGDIKIGRNLIELKADQDVVVHKGHILKLFETFIVTSGRYNGSGFNNYKTNGGGFSSEGIFKLLSSSIDNRVINFIADHLVLEYYNTNTFVDSELETNFKGVAFRFKNFGL